MVFGRWPSLVGCFKKRILHIGSKKEPKSPHLREETAGSSIQSHAHERLGNGMMNDSCDSIRPLLSAYFDGELTAEAAHRVSDHVESCAECQSELRSFGKISDWMQATADAVPPREVWEQIEREMISSVTEVVPASRANIRTKESRFAARVIALAASVLLLVGASVWMAGRRQVENDQMAMEHHDDLSAEHMAEFVGVMNQYLQKLPLSPSEADQFLIDKYKGERVDGQRAVELVGYHPIVSRGLPEGYSLASTSVLRMPCCTCVKAVCRRSDGSTLVLFEHDDEEVAWFGDRPSKLATCGDKECCLVELDESIAATWKQGTRSITAVGVRDDAEITKLVAWMESARSNG